MIRRSQSKALEFARLLLNERLDPLHAAAAVFVGIFIGIVPIYGFQTLAAVGLALLFKLNKPLTIACTFISNPLFLPVIIFFSVELGCLLRHGSFQPLSLSALLTMRSQINKEQFFIWVVGSVVLGIIVGSFGAVVTAIVVNRYGKSSVHSERVSS